jgi:uncharacterized protein YggE
VSDHVKVTGSASRSLAPDGVVWRADAVERDEDPRVAFERCTERLNELTARLSAVGEVSTSAVSVEPDWGVGPAADPVAGRRGRAGARGGRSRR